MPASQATEDKGRLRVSLLEVFSVFTKLGLSSFGGPIAHLGYFHDTFVIRRKWIDERAYADLVALCQFLPGPASSQLGIAIGLAKAGLPGALAAWIGFTLPSAILMTLFGLGFASFHRAIPQGVLHGLMIVAVAVVAQAVWGMAQRLCPDTVRRTISVIAAIGALAIAVPLVQVAIIAAGALAGLLLMRITEAPQIGSLGIRLSKPFAATMLALFFALLAGLPILAVAYPAQGIRLVASFYQAGALVFGGGHVVLPLLQSQVVPPGWISNDAFLSGYGAAQAVPGPLFTLAAYLGATMKPEPHGVLGATICLVAIFLPSFLLILGALPFWDGLRRVAPIQSALAGVNAAVVGLLLAALYNPVWLTAIRAPEDFALALGAFALLVFWKVPPWIVVLLSAASGFGLQL